MSRDRIPLRPIGFRLAHELDGLLEGIAADGVIVSEEVERLKRWRREAAPYEHITPFLELSKRVDHALADGVLTLEECEDIRFVAANLTTVNPYFDALRSGLQTLMGVLAGVTADGRVPDSELRMLTDWAESWSHLKGLWPYDECEAIVTMMLLQHEWQDGARYLAELAAQFPIGGHLTEHGELPPLLIGGVCAVDPIVTFQDKHFTFTGESERCERLEIHRAVEERSGIPLDNVTKKTDYLVVCDGGNPHWAFACYGRKVEKAYNLRRGGQPLVIMHERDFWDAIA